MPDRRNTTEDDCGYFEARELWEERRMTDRGERRPRSTISDEEVRRAAASAASELLLDEYALAAEALTDESAPVFGEWFVGIYACAQALQTVLEEEAVVCLTTMYFSTP